MSKKTRPVIIAGNWKMNHLQSETKAFFETCAASWEKSLSSQTRKAVSEGKILPLVFPPFLSLETAQKYASKLPIQVGAQNVHFEKTGAFTGEVSASMIQEIGLNWALVGHSERRQYFGETDESAKRRVEGLLGQRLNVMLCVGETREEREGGKTFDVLRRQLTTAVTLAPGGGANFFAPKPGQPRLVIAYEPVWAIGTGLTATPAQAEEVHQFIRKLLWDLFGMENSSYAQILYGGSVKPDNIAELLACPNIDGGLIGGASLKAEALMQMLEKVSDTFW